MVKSNSDKLGRRTPSQTSIPYGIPAGDENGHIDDWVGCVWTAPTFSAGNFTGNGSMTWTVESGDVVTLAYVILGKMMTVVFEIATTTVAGTPNISLQIAIPGSKVCARTTRNLIYTNDNGTEGVGMAVVLASATTIALRKDVSSSNWSAATNTTGARGQIMFEIQ